MVVKTPWQFGNRSELEKSNINNHQLHQQKDTILPQLKVEHPASRLADPQTLNLRGISRLSNRNYHQPQQDGISFPGIPEGADIVFGDDRSKCRLPIFGNPANISERIESRLSTSRSSRVGTSMSQSVSERNESRLSIVEILRLINDKLKTGYYTMKNLFESYDQNEKGSVDRETFRRILSTFLNLPLSYSQYNRLLKTLGFSNMKDISHNQFYDKIKQLKKSDTSQKPDFFFTDTNLSDHQNQTASYVHTQLQTEAINNPQQLLSRLNLLEHDNLIKPAFQDYLSANGYSLAPIEFDKLWRKYDSKNIGMLKAFDFLEALKKAKSRSPDGAPLLSKQNQPAKSLDKRISKKLGENLHDMFHAFKEFADDKGLVTRDQFLLVLNDYGMNLDEWKLDALLERFNTKCQANHFINFHEFLKNFQEREFVSEKNNIQLFPNGEIRKGTSLGTRRDDNGSSVETRLVKLLKSEHASFWNHCRKLDPSCSNTLTKSQFHHALESFLRTSISKQQFDSFVVTTVPQDENGNVKYNVFLNHFGKSKPSDTCSSIVTDGHLLDNNFDDDISSSDVRDDVSTSLSIDSCREDRTLEQLAVLIKQTLRQKFQLVEKVFFELDEKNTKRMTQSKFRKLLHRAGLKMSRTESDLVWSTFLTDQRGTLEYQHFVRHFCHSKKSAAFPNAKANPPTRGDSDFRVLSNRFNSWKDLMRDFAKNSLYNNQTVLKAKFEQLDTEGHGFVTVRQFKNILQAVCVGLSPTEVEIIIDKFSSSERIFWPDFLNQLRPLRNTSRQGHNMKDILKHSNNFIEESIEEE